MPAAVGLCEAGTEVSRTQVRSMQHQRMPALGGGGASALDSGLRMREQHPCPAWALSAGLVAFWLQDQSLS